MRGGNLTVEILSAIRTIIMLKTHHCFTIIFDQVPIFEITLSPVLHIMLGVFNHIWKNMENISEDNKKVLHDFAMKHNCIK